MHSSGCGLQYYLDSLMRVALPPTQRHEGCKIQRAFAQSYRTQQSNVVADTGGHRGDAEHELVSGAGDLDQGPRSNGGTGASRARMNAETAQEDILGHVMEIFILHNAPRPCARANRSAAALPQCIA